MSLHVTFSVPEHLEKISIICDGDLVVQGEVRDNIRVTYPEGTTQPKLESANSGMRLHSEDDARVQVPAGLDIVLSRVAGDVACNNLTGELRADAVPGDAGINNCRRVIFDTVNGDLALNRVEVGKIDYVSGDAALNHVEDASIDHVDGDLAANHCTTLTVALVNGDGAFNHVEGELDVPIIHGDAALNNIAGNVRLSEVHGDVVLRGSVSAGQRIHVRSWDSVTAMLSGPISLHSMTHVGELPDWDEIRRQPAMGGSNGGAEVLVAAGGELLFTGEGKIHMPGFSLFEKMPARPTPPTPPVPPSPTVETPAANAVNKEAATSAASEDETLKVLRMVQDGKISPEEGDMLLDALSR